MSWLKRLFQRRELFSDISEEIRQHLDERTDELIQRGLPVDEASAQARREFGNVASLEQSSRETWQWPRLESFISDVRYAFRQLRMQPTFAVVAILILAIGIGANVTVFSVVDTLVLEPLPFRAADRLVWIINSDTPGLSGRTHRVSTYEALTEMRSLEDITTYEAFFARSSYKLTGDLEPDRVAGVMVPDNFFPFLGVAPALGRTFNKQEMEVNGPGAVILSHSLWERRYSSDPNVIGREIVVNDRASTIVGVMPSSFDFGEVFAPGIDIEVYLPVPFDTVRDWGNTMAILGRLEPGMTIDAAQAEATALIERQQRERPDLGGGPDDYHAILRPFRESVVGNVRQPMLVLWAAVGLVLLIVCVNLSNLLLARAATRRKEMALRGAIGAGRFRLARQLLTESFVLSLIGGGLGVGLSYAAVAYVRRLEGLSIPLLKNVEIGGGVLAVALGVTIFTAILFGLAPAIAVVKGDVGSALKDSGRGSSEGRDHRLVRAGLVVSEVALACLLLIGAGLLLRSFLHVLDVDLGFQPEQTYVLRIDASNDDELGKIDTQEKFAEYIRRIMAAANSVPGVEASVTDAVPLDSNRSWGVRRKDQPPDQWTGALVKVVGPRLMATMRTPVIAGREFSETDDETREPVTLINQSLAERLWPGEDPIGQPLISGNFERRVIGVVADVRHLSVEESAGPEFYVALLQSGSMSPSLVVRTSRPFSDVAPGLRSALTEVVSDLPTASFMPLDQVVDRALSGRRFFVDLLIAFAAAALLLAAIGIYGVIAYSVTRRTAEIGIRMALGATAGGVRASVVSDTMRLTVIGIAIGLVSAAALSSLMTSLLYGVSPSDPWTFGAAAGVLLLVAAAAGFIPAARASRISPISALRAD
jgi:predicted permease